MKLEDRYLLFAAITVSTVFSYQWYHNYHNDKYINEAIETNNKRTVRYVEIINKQREEIGQWRSASEHWKAMYHGSQTSNYQLEQQIDVINNYWKKEITKVFQKCVTSDRKINK